ncbi:peptidase M22 [Bittarella massiliensis]|uniref:peptidase M22 n=1 Tax=Bittarella (ex Durand et al. 2017) TaxID=1929297 RepID=UPI00163BCEFF|nr:peptidase M22 [Bittarella massiliensis (ex Durand et al. 2017)]MBC2870648.1 peptidase M22 [Bittarella massiliensis (ex Durand et al. 2017)]
MKYFLGLDTSNYTSSLAVCSAEGEVVQNIRLPLPVKEGQMGLRQSDACFLHVKNFSELTTSILGGIPVGDVLAVGVSDRPRDIEGSYMPCFLVGLSSATLIANLLGLPLYRFSHQQGHIAAALYGGGALPYLQGPFLAFHVSGGTTEAVLVEPDGERICKTTYLAGSLDLKAGQAVDRVGGLLGLPFPAGPALDKLACQSEKHYQAHPTFKGCDCCLSGVENQCRKMLSQGEAPADVARYCLDYLLAALDGMTARLLEKLGPLPVLYSGGVMSNSILSATLSQKYGGVCAPASFSSDNAAGIALLCRERWGR